MSSVAYGNDYEDVFVFEDLVYAMECQLGVVHAYRNRNNSLFKSHDIIYQCQCKYNFLCHSIIVTNACIVQCCARDKLIFILGSSGKVLQTISLAHISEIYPVLCQIDAERNILVTDRYSNLLLIVHVDQSSSGSGVLNLLYLPQGGGCCGAVWFRHRLHVLGHDDQPMTFTPVDVRNL